LEKGRKNLKNTNKILDNALIQWYEQDPLEQALELVKGNLAYEKKSVTRFERVHNGVQNWLFVLSEQINIKLQ